MKKKILSLVLALLMTASSASAILADDVAAIAEEPAIEEEVEVAAGQYDRAIEFLNNYGIFKGKGNGDLGAEDMLERYQMALFVSRIATGWVEDEQWEDGPEDWSGFTDISEGPVANYWGALSYATSKGIINGYGNGKFGPSDGITYQDALTMVVRTLGFQGLDWPWGYIEKAVELGLTDGITGITYSEALNRGEVAQILYNALFATTKSGSTLGLDSFGIEFGWEKVIITASDLDIYTKDRSDAYSYAKDGGYKGFDKTNKTAPGYVAFNILNDDGTVGEDTYYMLASDIGLSTDATSHEDEAVVGDAYYILFEKDADSNLCKTVAYESLLVDTIVNEGKTDDEGEAQDYAIQEFLADYKLVSKYTGKEYLNVTASGKDELMIYTATSTYTEYAEDGNYLAIDWTTGDILGVVYTDEDEDGRIDEDEIAVDEDGNYVYEILWYYNELLDKYYELEIDEDYDDDDDDDRYYINYMSDAEFEKTYKEFIKYAQSTHNGYKLVDSISKSAYASLKIYDTDLDGVAERGIYESYRLGKFSQDTAWCGHKNMTRYNISNVTAFGHSDIAVKNQEGAQVSLTTVSNFAEGDSCGNKCQADRAWFVEGYTPVANYDEDGEFTGYAEGYVIYTYDKETGAIKVVKNINDGSDDDSYVATGVLRAYNLKDGTITVGDTKYEIGNYNELIGNAFRYVKNNATTRSAYSDLFRSLFNQFVEIVVVDGEVVNVRAKSASDSKLIIVDSYAGLSNDGYIVVNGYSTSDLKYDQFRIGSYDGWVKGDYFYNLTEEKAEASFTKGTMYAVASYNAEEDVYYVNLAGEWDDGEYTVKEGNGVKLRAATIIADDDGYMDYSDNDDTNKYRKMASTDKYVIIPVADSKAPTAPVYVYEGKLPAGAKITGDRINSGSYDNTTYVIVNATVENFSQIYDSYKTGLVLLLNDSYIIADYNGTDAEDWYLLGSSVYEVEAFDVLAGKYETIYAATNLDLEVGHIYFTQDGVAVEDLGVLEIAGIPAVMNAIYPNNGLVASDDASYAYGSFVVTESNYKSLFDKEKLANLAGLPALLGQKKYRGNIDEILVYTLEYKDDEVVAKSFGAVDADDIKELMEDYEGFSLYANWVYGISSTDIVVYIDITDGEGSFVEVSDLDYTNPVKVWETEIDDAEAYIEAEFGYTTTTTTVNGVETVTTVIDGVRLTFGGYDVENATHKIVAENDWFFGAEGECDFETIIAKMTFDGVACYPVRDSIVLDTYDCDDCNLVKSVYIPFTTATVGADGKLDVDASGIEIADADLPDEVVIVLNDAIELDNGLIGTAVEFVASVDVYTDRPDDYTVNNGFIADYEVEDDVYAFIG